MGNLGKLNVAKGSKSCPTCNKSPNLVTLIESFIVGEAEEIVLSMNEGMYVHDR